MPFVEKPDGMSAEALELLDSALTKLWLEQVAIGAAQLGASPQVANDLRQHIHRLTELSQRRPIT